MDDTNLKNWKARNLGMWLVAALLYPVAHWIPTASGHPPRIFDVLIPVVVLGLGIASNSMIGATVNRSDGE